MNFSRKELFALICIGSVADVVLSIVYFNTTFSVWVGTIFLLVAMIFAPLTVINTAYLNAQSNTKYVLATFFAVLIDVYAILLCFAAIYRSQSGDSDIGAFHKEIGGLYLSVMTWTTVGYGDVLPQTDLARVAAMLEAIVGFFANGAIIAAFVTYFAKKGVRPTN